MSKKNFKTSLKPQPTPEAIDKFVSEGHGRDVQSMDTEIKKHRNTEDEPMKRLTIDLPESLHRQFKSLTGLEGSKMVDEVRQFIERRVAEATK